MLFTSSLSLTSSYSNIKIHLAAIKHFLLLHGFHTSIPPLPRLYMLTRAIKRKSCHHKKPKRLPITPAILIHLQRYLINSHYSLQNQKMLWAAFTTAFFGFLRSSEFTAPTIKSYHPETTLLVSDVTLKQSRLNINIKTSKTDPFHHGCSIRLSQTNTVTCPVNALTDFLRMHPTQQGPLFTYSDGTFLTRRRLNSILKLALSPLASSQRSVSTHSFRIGAATTAAAAGFLRWLIQQLGRWNSDCFRSYIDIPDSTIDNVATSLTKQFNINGIWDPDLRS